MSNIGRVREELVVGRGDPVYMAHGYLTKVPVPAIMPFIQAYTRPGDVVVDPFAGSGMTGVAAAALGRRARLFDVSVLGRHIGRNYVNLVDRDVLTKQADEVVRATRERLADAYGVECLACERTAQLVKTIWSFQVACSGCGQPVSYYRAMEAAGWSKREMKCPACGSGVVSRDSRVGEVAEVDSISCTCSSKQREQPASPPRIPIDLGELPYPRVEITPDRQMYKAQSLGRSGLTTVASFYAPRNLAVLTVLHEQIGRVEDVALRQKLLFAFTSILTRASKRYQWSPVRPLNAANANYYVASVFYEWNVFDLFERKIEAMLRSDDWLRSMRSDDTLFGPGQLDLDVTYELASAETIPLPDASVDYVYTDPPFGSNLFYADMALFQEAWLDGFTDVTQEAVVDRGSKKQRSASRYEQMMTQALSECRRILKPGGRISMVFGNSTGSMWSLVQRSIQNAGLVIEPDQLVVLNKGQRSVKGLASGFEDVATLDLIMTMVPNGGDQRAFVTPPRGVVVEAARAAAADGCHTTSPSHIYLELLRRGMREHWDLSALDLRVVTHTLIADGWQVEESTGRLCKDALAVPPLLAQKVAARVIEATT
jgi:16S rRNA G966 N2-methylase RsmD